MTQKIPQFYQQWIRDGLEISEFSAFAYHSRGEYAYLIMGGSEDTPADLSIFVFLNPGKDRMVPEYLIVHRIHGPEVDNCIKLLDTLKKVA